MCKAYTCYNILQHFCSCLPPEAPAGPVRAPVASTTATGAIVHGAIAPVHVL